LWESASGSKEKRKKMKLLLSLLMLLTIANALDKLSTAKTSCLQQSAYPNKTLAEQKKILIEKAKQESLEELYGTLISSSTDIQNGKMISDSIKSRAVGAVRVKGNPSFYNGKNLGEICTDVNVYITKKDLEKYSPKKVSLTHYCFNNPSVAMKDIKREAKYGAYKEMISQYKASLKLTGKQAEQFIHEFIISNDKFDFDTASYCFNAVGTILPYELEMGINSNDIEKRVISSSSSEKGLIAYYPFDGDAQDKSGHSHNGSLIGDVDFVEGMKGKAAYFPIWKSLIRLPAELLNNRKEGTVSLWTRYNSSNGMGLLSTTTKSGENEFLIWLGEGKVTQEIHHKEFKTEKVLNDGKYHMITITFKINQFNIYIDGKLYESFDYGVGRLKIASDIWLGCDQDKVNGGFDSSQQFLGYIDELKFYDRMLSASEVKVLYK
jgi:hypothetical protein